MITLSPIGRVRSTRREPEDDHWDSVTSSVELDSSRFGASALAGLADFSHVEVLFYMDQVDPRKIATEARHPRNNPEWPKVGIFAQRGKNRPNRIGATICRVRKVEGTTLHLIGFYDGAIRFEDPDRIKVELVAPTTSATISKDRSLAR
jgi:tRNA (Thr-GGU) A37 N-methylase